MARHRKLTETLQHPSEYRKAIYGAVVAGLGTLATALAPEAETGLVSVTAAEATGIVLAAVTAFGTVYWANNTDAPTS